MLFLFYTILAAILFSSGGAMMKTSEGLTKLWPSLICLGLFVAGACSQAIAMRRAEMSTTHIFVLGIEVIIALIFGLLFFKEDLSLPKMSGAFLIILGVIILRK